MPNYDTMSGTTKYQPVPGRDSFDDAAPSSYSQAPPSYQADQSQGLLGAPRTEDDNVPDDFKVRIDIGRGLWSRELQAMCRRQKKCQG